MLKSASIRSKILAVLALPLVVVLVMAAVIGSSSVTRLRSSSAVEQLSESASGFSIFLAGMQAERSLSLQALRGSQAATDALPAARADVDGGLARVQAELASIPLENISADALDAVADSARAHDELPRLRGVVDSGGTLRSISEGYSDVIAVDVALPGRVAQGVRDVGTADDLRAFTHLLELGDAVARESDAGALVLLGEVTTEQEVALAVQPAAQASALQAIEDTIGGDVRVGIERAVADGTTGLPWQIQRARASVLSAATGAPSLITAPEWQELGAARSQAVLAQQAVLSTGSVVTAAQQRTGDTRQTWLVFGVLALSLLVPTLLALVLARRITRPLRRLTEAAGEIRTALPAMVERMQIPGEGPGVVLPEILVESGDEVGRLAAAFNDVNATTVQVAQEQAALRGSIADMFVNVARRNQVLLSRQLTFIDQLERTEEDPDTLANLFRLDHLATRMRRNSESLLVLAGIDAGRRLRRPMPLSDVVRTAYSEIEHYERVHLALQLDPPVVGHVALAASHMLAELLENATNFSDPGSRVVVSTAPGPRGIRVTVTDEGLGMSDEELAEANQRIAEPPVAAVVGAQRLGFFVVGRLARRLDARVSLRAGRQRGTIVTIDLPPSLFTPGAVPELPSSDVSAPADADRVDGAPRGRTDSGTHAAGPVDASVDGDPAATPRRSRGLRIPRAGAASSRRARRGRGTTPTGASADDGASAAPATPTGAVDPTVTGAATKPAPVAKPRATEGAAPQPPAVHDSPATARPAPVSSSSTIATPAKAATPPPVVTPPALPRPAPVREAVQAAPLLPEVGTPSLNILPGRHGGRGGVLGRRRPSTPPAAQAASAARPPVPVLPAVPPAPRHGGAVPHPSAAPPSHGATPGAASSAARPAPAAPTAAPPAARTSSPFARPAGPQAGAPGLRPAVEQAAAAALAEVAGLTGAVPVGDLLRQRSALASEALSELSRLSTYAPESAADERRAPAPLVRRVPAATAAATVEPPTVPSSPASRRQRSATDVRSMLSGFQAGVERGRTAPATETNEQPTSTPSTSQPA